MYGCSKRGEKTFLYHNFEYFRERVNANGTTSWRCCQYQRLSCKARLLACGLRVVDDRQPDHVHAGNISTSLARKAVGDMKNRMEELTATPSLVHGAVLPTVTPSVLMALPKRATVLRTLRRYRLKKTVAANGGVDLPALPKDLLFNIPDRFSRFILFDSGPADNRIIILGSNVLLDGLARADVWLADGTFKVVPGLFFQLFSIHFSFGAGINPAAVYCLLTNKTAETYARFLHQLSLLIPTADPKNILVDFEKASMNAFQEAYPNSHVTGCYFHLCQSVLRKVNEIGLKIAYEADDIVRGYVRCIPALAFVPPEDVQEAFDLLADDKPEVDHIDELLTFFEHTYIRGRRLRGRGEAYGPALFSIDLWNQHAGTVDGIARTNNSVEGWHHSLQSLFQCHHPTLWTFMDGVSKDILKQTTVFLQGATGINHPSKKTYRLLNERVERAVGAYGRAEILTYLRAMAHLSHV